MPRTRKTCCCKCSGTDKVATVLLISIAVTVLLALSIAIAAEIFDDAMRKVHCHWVIDYNDTIDICGNKTLNEVSTSDDCINECKMTHADQLSAVYYLNSTFSDIPQTCYCLSESQWNEINTESDTESKYNDYCFESVNVSDTEEIVNKYVKKCPLRGRPYVQPNNKHLLSDITYIPCVEYKYYANNEWKAFITNYTDLQNNTQHNALLNEWIKQALAEHASIATFSRFTLELMSVAAPFWLIQLSNKAGLDEIKHAQISFDIANFYLHAIYDDDICVAPNKFPSHTLQINADWNKIATDTAIGGCFGETVAALTMHTKRYHNMMDDYISEIAIEEVRHAALAWVVVKWMIDNYASHMMDDMDVANQDWWEVQIANRKRTASDVHALYVYEYVIPFILEQMWIVEDYMEFYLLIIESIPQFAESSDCDNICTFFSFEGDV